MAYLSGAVEYFDMLERGAEETTVLASDDSSSSLLLGLLNLLVRAYKEFLQAVTAWFVVKVLGEAWRSNKRDQ